MVAPVIVNAFNIPYPTTVEVHFDQVMLADAELTRPSNYLFDHGAFTIGVSQIDKKQVRLVVSNLFEFDTFTVTVSSNVKNDGGESVSSGGNSAVVSITRPTIDSSFLAISSTNGRLRSGERAIQVAKGSDKWYIMTESGVDIINNVSLANEGFILDGYGFNTIFVG